MLGAVGVALALAGCGGGGRPPSTTETRATGATTTTTTTAASTRPAAVSKAAYVARMRALGRTLGDEVGKIYPISTGVRGSALESATERRLEHARAVIERVLAGVRSMHPPHAVASDQRRLERGLAGIAAELGQLVTDIRNGDYRSTLVPSQLEDLDLVTSATASMERKGYDVLGRNAG